MDDMDEYEIIEQMIRNGKKQIEIDKKIADIELTSGLDFSDPSCKRMVSEYIDRFHYFTL